MPCARSASCGREITPTSEHHIRANLDTSGVRSLPDGWGRSRDVNEARCGAGRRAAICAEGHTVSHVLDRKGPGKYRGAAACAVAHRDWWAEGDWLIWTARRAGPQAIMAPAARSTSTPAGAARSQSGLGFHQDHRARCPVLLSHNDAFQFQRNIRVAEETFGMTGPA